MFYILIFSKQDENKMISKYNTSYAVLF